MNEVTKCDLKSEDIIRMAKEAGLIHYHDSDGQWSGVTNDKMIDEEKNQWDDKLVEILAPFAALVAAAEREACAKVCEEVRDGFASPRYATGQPLSSIRERFAAGQCVEAIRARSSE